MGRKILLTLTFLALTFQKTFCQEYTPMLNNSSWNLISANFLGAESLIITGGVDVTIGSYTYKKYTDPTIYSSDNYVREDVSSKRVYRNVGGVDQLLYDFSLQPSDNIILGDGNNYRVMSVTNVNIVGGTRKMIYLIHYIGSIAGNSETWIEGVGSNRHPLKPQYEMFFSDPYIFLNCSAQNGVDIYNHGIANGQPTPTDCSILLSTEEINNLKQNVSFSPNPFKTELFISTKLNLENATLKIYNSIGQLVKEIKNIYGQKITVNKESLSNGIYIVKLFENVKILTTNKIILSD